MQKKILIMKNQKKKDHSIFKFIIENKRLYKWSKSINDNYHKSKIDINNPYTTEIYQFDKMLDNFYHKLNNNDNIKLGRFYDKNKQIDDKIFNESKNRFYTKYLNNKNLAIDNI